MGRAVHTSLSVAALAAVVGVMSCREPTQITVAISTDTLCPSEPLTAPRMVDVMFASAIKMDLSTFVEVTTTSECTAPERKEGEPVFAPVGTLVLLPSGDDPGLDVLVVAGVELAAPSEDISPLRLSSQECQALIQSEGPGAIGGKPCILSRRRLGFVDHTKLALPIELDSRCIGKKCGEDQTCFKGNCVSLEVQCDENGCKPPPGACDDDCDAGCASGTGRCTDGACECLPCDVEVCGDTCELAHGVGVCTENDLCLCKTCEPAACTDLCGGTCTDQADCGCGGSCDPTACASAGTDCSCTGDPESCECIVPDCMDDTCAQQACDFGELGVCGTNQSGQETCTCTCDDDACNADCPQGGSCQAGSCSCSLCDDSQCAGLTCDVGKVAECYQGGCACVCDDGECQDDCIAGGSSGGACDSPGTPQGLCGCGGPSNGGGPPNGGSGGDGGAGSGGAPTGGAPGVGGGPLAGGPTNTDCMGLSLCEASTTAACPSTCASGFGHFCDPDECECRMCTSAMAIDCPGEAVWNTGGTCSCCGIK